MVENLLRVESVCIGVDKKLRDVSFDYDDDDDNDDLYLCDEGWVEKWVCGDLRRLSISDFWAQSCWRRSNLLSLLSSRCHNLAELEVKNAWLSADNLNPMPMLTSLTLEFIRLDDEDLNELNRCFPNLQVLKLIGVGGFKLPKIHLLNLKTCHWTVSNVPSSLALITPNLVTLRLECIRPTSLYVEAPMVSNFRLSLDQPEAFAAKKFQNLKTLWLESLYIGSLLLKFPITETVENLTLDSRYWAKGAFKSSQLITLEKVFTVFPNVTTLCINSSAWSELLDLVGIQKVGR
ncbi:F-box/LRR-repeat protein [Tanacetum coccineum]